MTKLFSAYLKSQLPEEYEDYKFTSINVNKNYAGRLHRDGNNVGPSVIKAFGDFSGGKLLYYQDDDKSVPLEELPENGKGPVPVDISQAMMMFDGRRAHEV